MGFKEFLEHEKNGVLVDFFDIQSLVNQVCEVLAKPEKFAPLRLAARQKIVEELDLKSTCLPALLRLFKGR